MDVDIDTERTRVDNPDTDKTGGADIELMNLNPYDSSSRRGSVDPTGLHKTYEETSFITGGDTSETEPLLGLLKILRRLGVKLRKNIPKLTH